MFIITFMFIMFITFIYTYILGMVILRDAEGIIKRVENAKVVVFGCGIEGKDNII